MVLVLIAIAVGILIVAILIIKASKTSSQDVLGVNLHCMKCGDKTNGAKCPKCEKNKQSFGV
jgi:rubrerythrin